MNKQQLHQLIKECFSEIKQENKVKSVVKELVSETLNEMGKRGRPRKEDAIPMDVQIKSAFKTTDFEGVEKQKNVVYMSDLKGDVMLQDRIAKELGYKAISSIDAYVSAALYEQLSGIFTKEVVPFREVLSIIRDEKNEFDTIGDEPIEIANKLASEFMTNYRADYDKKVFLAKKLGQTTTPGVDAADPQFDSGTLDEPVDTDSYASREIDKSIGAERPYDEDELSENKKKLIKLIRESVEEIKAEKKTTTKAKMAELTKAISSVYDEASAELDKYGDYEINGEPHYFRIRPQYNDVFDVTYIKDGADRTKKLNVKFEELKEFVLEKLKSKENNSVDSAHNKAKSGLKDKVEKSDLPKNDVLKQKKVGTDKNEDKTFIEKNDDGDNKQDAPMKEVEKIKKQADHPVKGTTPDYTKPKDVNKKHVVKGKASRKFKGLPKK